MSSEAQAFIDVKPDSVTIEVPVEYSMVLSVRAFQQSGFVASVSIGQYNRPHSFVKITKEQAEHVIALLQQAITKASEAKETTE